MVSPDEDPSATTTLNEGNSISFEPETFTITAPPENVDEVEVVVEEDTTTDPTVATVNLSGATVSLKSESDEMLSFVGRKTNQQWRWLAMDVSNRQSAQPFGRTTEDT